MTAPLRHPVRAVEERFFRGLGYGLAISLCMWLGILAALLALAGCWQGDPTVVRGDIDHTIPEERP